MYCRLTRIPLGPNSNAIHFENPINPNFVVEYTACCADPLIPDILLTFTKLPPSSPFPICGIHALVTLNTPFRFVFTSLSQYASLVSSSGIDVGFTPAQLKTWSRRPNLESVSVTNLVTSWTEETSTSSRWGFVEEEQALEVASRLSKFRSQRESVAPRVASLIAVARLQRRD